MIETQTKKKSLEVIILRNIRAVEKGRLRVWCEMLFICPYEGHGGEVLGFRANSTGVADNAFRRNYEESEAVSLDINPNGGTLKIGDDSYNLFSWGVQKDTLTLTPGCRNPNAEIWDYITSLKNKK